jgi:hypothetical protein
MNAIRSNEIRKKITYLAVLVGNFLFITSCNTMLIRIEKKPWFVSAKNYVEGYELTQKSGVSQEEKESLSIAQIERARKNYLNSRQPTAQEILVVFNSKDDEKTKIALGAMVLRPLTEYEVMKKIIFFWDHPSRVHRDFASRALVSVDRADIEGYQDLGDMIFEHVKRTRDDWVLSNGIRMLGKFKYLPFIRKYLKKHDNPLYYYSSFEALKEMDDIYFQQVRNQLQREGDTETLKYFERTDDFWKRWHRTDKQSSFEQDPSK